MIFQNPGRYNRKYVRVNYQPSENRIMKFMRRKKWTIQMQIWTLFEDIDDIEIDF